MNFNAFTSGYLIYTIYFFLLLLFTLFRYNKTNQQNLWIFIFFIGLQVLIGGLRSQYVGTDTRFYVAEFNKIADYSYGEIIRNTFYREPAFYMLVKFLYSINGNYTFTLLVFQLFFWLSVSFVLYKHTDSCLLALSLFVGMRFTFFAMSGLRQTMAMGILFFSINYLMKDRKIWFILIVLVASLFHTSSLIFLTMVFFTKPKMYKGILVTILSVVFLLVGFILPDVQFDEDIIYSNYLNAGDEKMGNYFSLITTIIPFLFIHGKVANKTRINSITNITYKLSLFAFLFSLMGVSLTLAFRISMYFSMFMPVIMANLIADARQKKELVIIFVAILTIIYVVTGIPRNLSYEFYWENNEGFVY